MGAESDSTHGRDDGTASRDDSVGGDAVADEGVPEQTDNSPRPEDGPQDVDQEPHLGEDPDDP